MTLLKKENPANCSFLSDFCFFTAVFFFFSFLLSWGYYFIQRRVDRIV